MYDFVQNEIERHVDIISVKDEIMHFLDVVIKQVGVMLTCPMSTFKKIKQQRSFSFNPGEKLRH